MGHAAQFDCGGHGGGTAMSFEVKGWCPGALRPMASGDGLVVRVRLPLGMMTPAQTRGLADAAQRYGNGQMEVSNRGNLQLRGVSEDSHRPLLADLAALGVLDADLALESRRNILISPLWKSGDGTIELAQALQARLMDLPDLPGKFGHVIDIGVHRVLAEAPGDIRVERGLSGGLILRADGAELGQPVSADGAISALIDLAEWFVAGGGIAMGRGRMRALVARLGPPPLARELPVAAAPRPAPGQTAQGLLAGFEFGSFAAQTLLALSYLGRPLRMTPWRMVLIGGLSDPLALADVPGLITDPDDPMLAVRACPGAPFCPQALAPTRDLARALAPMVSAGQIVHVSGCAKGCAHPLAADVTFVAGPDGFATGLACAAPDVFGPARSAQAILHEPTLFAQSGAV